MEVIGGKVAKIYEREDIPQDADWPSSSKRVEWKSYGEVRQYPKLLS